MEGLNCATPLPFSPMLVSDSLLSLKKSWLEACPHTVACTISPLGFKYSIRSTIDFLLCHQISATLWLKLPAGSIWHTDIDRYADQAQHIYSFERERYRHGGIARHSQWQSLAITEASALRGEYLFLAVTEDFVCALAAIQQPVTLMQTDAAESAKPKRKMVLRLYSTCSPNILHSLRPMLHDLAKVAPASSESTTLLNHWHICFPHVSQVKPSYQEAFLSWQLRSQARLTSLSQNTAGVLADNHPTPPPKQPNPDLEATPQTLTNQQPQVSTTPTPDFLELASQELRSPLTTIKTALTLLNAPKLKSDQRQRYLDMIHHESDRQSSLVQSVFELLQLQVQAAPPIDRIQLKQWIPSIVSTYEPIAQEHQISLQCNIPDDLPDISGYTPWLQQALMQLLNNGIQFTPAGGLVTVTAEASSPQFVTLAVEDTGRGISHGDLPKIFDAFYRGATLGNEHRAGLGLTLAKQLIIQCNGTLSVESTLAKGSRFTLEIPRQVANDATP